MNVLKWLNLKGDISLTDDLGGSPLHDAAEQGQFEVCKLSLFFGNLLLKVNGRTIQYNYNSQLHSVCYVMRSVCFLYFFLKHLSRRES